MKFIMEIPLHGLGLYGYLLLPVLTGVTRVHSIPDTRMSSWFNDNTGERAVDGDLYTCSITGLEVGPWWKVDLGYSRPVTQVGIHGVAAAAFQIRVGNNTSDVEDESGFAHNPLCVFNSGQKREVMTYYRCRRVRYGRYLSIHIVDPAYPEILRICEIDIK